MYFTDKFTDPEAKADAVRANMTDMIVGYVLDQLGAANRPVRTSEDLDELVQKTRAWLRFRQDITPERISDFVCRMYYDFAGNN